MEKAFLELTKSLIRKPTIGCRKDVCCEIQPLCQAKDDNNQAPFLNIVKHLGDAYFASSTKTSGHFRNLHRDV